MTIDTNIVIAYLAGDPLVVKTLSGWREEGKTLFLPTIVESELLSFSSWASNQKKQVENFLEENFTSISFDRNLARIAAEVRSEARIKFPDAAIASVALFTRTPLVTRNQRDFRKIPGLSIVTI